MVEIGNENVRRFIYFSKYEKNVEPFKRQI